MGYNYDQIFWTDSFYLAPQVNMSVSVFPEAAWDSTNDCLRRSHVQHNGSSIAHPSPHLKEEPPQEDTLRPIQAGGSQGSVPGETVSGTTATTRTRLPRGLPPGGSRLHGQGKQDKTRHPARFLPRTPQHRQWQPAVPLPETYLRRRQSDRIYTPSSPAVSQEQCGAGQI